MADDVEQALSLVMQQYPVLQQYNYAARRSPGRNDGRKLEFYHPEEPTNPFPGRPTIDVFDKGIKGELLQRALFGDALHYLPDVDPKYQSLKALFVEAMPKWQQEFMGRKWDYLRRYEGEQRDMGDWFDRSGSDAMIRGYLAPDEADEWRQDDFYTEKQKMILEAMKAYLAGQ